MKFIIIIIVVASMFSACTRTTKAIATKQEKRTIEMQDAIENKRWVLDELQGKKVPKMERDIYISFKNAGAFDGHGGCNSFTGHYKIERKTIALSDMVSTEMACTDIMEIETQFFTILQQANGYKVVQDHLSLLRDSEELASFTAIYLK